MAFQEYFIVILPDGVTPVQTTEGANAYVGRSVLKMADIENAVQAIGKAVKPFIRRERRGFLVDENIVVTPIEEDGNIREILIQGSFSWFEESLEDVFSIGNELNRIAHVQFFRPLHDYIEIGDKEKFVESMTFLYQDRLREFRDKYGIEKIRIEPEKLFGELEYRSTWKRVIDQFKLFFKGKS